MTESDWLTATDPQAMLSFLREGGRLSPRKARVFAVACCRLAWHLMTDEGSRGAVEVAERYADGEANADAMHEANKAAWLVHIGYAFAGFESNRVSQSKEEGNRQRVGWAASEAVLTAAWWEEAEDWRRGGYVGVAAGDPAGPVSNALYYGADPGEESEVSIIEGRWHHSALCILLRDMVAPFAAPPRIDEAWLAWNDCIIPKLAEAAYEFRSLPSGHLDNARLAVLGDALEDAGCTDAQLLAHLREPSAHVRGCFAVDAVLGKS